MNAPLGGIHVHIRRAKALRFVMSPLQVHRTERGRSKEKSKEKTKIGLISDGNRPFLVRKTLKRL